MCLKIRSLRGSDDLFMGPKVAVGLNLSFVNKLFSWSILYDKICCFIKTQIR
jgi:hypothetical protein